MANEFIIKNGFISKGDGRVEGGLNIGSIGTGTSINNLGIDSSGNVVTGTTFTGNTSGDCITDLYVTNLYGCSPITVHDTIESVTGVIRTSGGTGAELNLKDSFGPNGTWSITSDNRGYGANSVWAYAQPSNGLQLGYQLTLSEAIGISIFPSGTTPLLGNGKEVIIANNTSLSVNSGNIDKRSVFVGTRNSTMLGGVTNSVVLGGVGLSATQDDTVYVDSLNINTIDTGTTVYLLGANSSGTVIQANDIYSDICAFCSSNISGDTIIGTGTTETDSVNGEGDSVSGTSPYSCTQWCAYNSEGTLVASTTNYETTEGYKLSGYIVRCCDSNSNDGGTDYGISISADTTTPGDNPPNVISGLVRPFTVRNTRKVSFLNSHKSDVLNSNQVSISDSTLGRIELSTLSSIESSFNSEIYGSNLSTILSSENGFISNSSNASIIGSQYSVLSGVTGSTIIGGNNITGTDNDTVYVPKLNIGTLGGGASINNLGIDVNGNVVVGTAGGGTPEATTATTTTINFTGQTIYYNAGSPATGNITQDLTGAKLGLIQKIYHNDATEPTYPGMWVLMGDAIYFTSQLNIIYAEWAGGSRVEYWYVQEQ